MLKSSWRIGSILLAMTLLVSGCNLLTSFQGPDDKALTSDIQAKLFQDPVLKTRDIRILSQKGVVVLTGTVNDDQEKSAVERIAGEAKGVKQVINSLTVAAPTPAPAPVAAAPAEAPASAASNPPPAAPRHTRHTQVASSESSEQPAVAESAPPSAPSASAPPPAQADSTPAPPPPPQQATIQAGETITIRTIDSIDSSRNRPGEEFAAIVDAPIVVDNQVVIPRGSDARIRLVEARSAGHMSGKSELQVELVSVTVKGTSYPVESGLIERTGASRGKRSAETIGGGAGLGALIGAIAGGGKGAAIGAGIGAGAGTGVQLGTHGQQVRIPSETKLDFTLKSPLTVTL